MTEDTVCTQLMAVLPSLSEEQKEQVIAYLVQRKTSNSVPARVSSSTPTALAAVITR